MKPKSSRWFRPAKSLATAFIVVTLSAGKAQAADTVLDNLAINNGSTYTVGAGDTLTVGSGSGNYLHVASGGGTTGTLDVSLSDAFTANVGNFYVGTGGSGGTGTANLGALNTITASTLFGVGTSFWDWTTGTLTTAASGTTTIHTPDFKIGWAIANGTSSGTGSMTIGSGASLTVDGVVSGNTSGRAAMWIGYDEEQYGRSSSGTLDLSAGTASLTLSSLMVGGQTGNGNTPGTLTMGTGGTNHLDVSGTGNVVRIGYLGLFGGSGTGVSTGTVTLANLDSTSQVVSTDNSTAIMIGERVATASGSTTGTLNLIGGSLTITTTGTAIGTAGSGGTSNLNIDGTTLKAGASSSTWIQGLTSAKIKSGGVTFDTNGFDIGVAQALLEDSGSTGGGLTKLGSGTLTLTGTNTFTGATTVNGGKLVVTSGSALLSTSVSIGAAELQYNSSTALGVAPVFTSTGGRLNATGTISGALDVTAGNALAVVNPVGTLTLSGLTLGDDTSVEVASGGNSLVQVNGDFNASAGAHTLISGLATPDTPYTFIQWTGTSNLSDGVQSNWSVQEGDTGTKNWTAATSGSWETATAWDGLAAVVSADTAEKTLSYTMAYVESGNKAPTAGNDVVINPATSSITVTGPTANSTVKSLQVGGANNSSPTLTLSTGTVTITETATVTGNGTLNAAASALIAPTLNVNSAGATANLGHASGSITTANVSAGSLTINAGSITTANLSGGTTTVTAGTVTTANLSGTASLAGSHPVAQVNVTGGTPAFSGNATAMSVTGGTLTTSGGIIGTLTLPASSTGTVTFGTGTTVGTADFTAGDGIASASTPLAIATSLDLPGDVSFIAGAIPFGVLGTNLVDAVDTVILNGDTTTISQSIGGISPGLEVRAWQSTGDAQIDGSRFNITVENPAGSSTHSTFAGTIGYATESINMGGNDQEHFGNNTNSGVPNASTRPTGYANNYTLEYRGKLYIPADGTYRFATTSDDGSALWIGQGDVATANPSYSTADVQNSNWQGMTLKNSGQISLTEGYHDFIVRFYEGGGGNGLQVQWDPTGGTSWAAIPGSNFFHGGIVASPVSQPNTDIAVTTDSILNLDYNGAATLGDVAVAAGTLTFNTATSVSLDNIAATGNGAIAAGTPVSLRGGQVAVLTDKTLTVNAPIVDGTSPTVLTKAGAGTLTLAGTNSYTGATVVSGGTLALGASASLNTSGIELEAGTTLDTTAQSYAIPAAKPVTIHLDSAGAGSSGKITAASLDISSASVVVEIDNETALNDPVYVLAEYTSLTGTEFSSVTAPPSGYAIDYNYNGENKIAWVQESGGDYAAWDALYDEDLSDPAADFDGDGLSNFQEYAFGLNPISAASSNPIGDVSQLKTNGIFTYSRRFNSGLTYTVWSSGDLQEWDDVTPVVTESQLSYDEETGIEVIEVGFAEPPTATNLFVRVKAEEPAN